MKKKDGLTLDDLNSLFIKACEEGDLEKVRYVLTDPELSIHANINYVNDQGLLKTCQKKYLELAKYLVSSPELKTHANPVHLTYDDKVMDYLVIEVGWQPDKQQKEHMKKYMTKESYRQLTEKVKKMRVVHVLEESLPQKDKKFKIKI